MKKIFITALAISVLGGFASASSASAAPYCDITWGSLPKTAADTSAAVETLNNIRTGRHDCYDRMVIDTSASGTG
jgi:hypothetical protein